jgi:sugar phosphate isomerase/epimerase
MITLKISINTWFSGSSTIEYEISRLSSLHFDGCEIAGFPGNFTEAKRASMRKMVKKLQLQIVSVSAGVPFVRTPNDLNLHSVRPAVRKQSVEYVRRCIDLASDIESTLVYVCSVTKDHHSNSRGRLVKSLLECAEYADRVGVGIALEHFPGGEVSTFEQALDIVSSVGVRNLGLLLDTGHLLLTRESIVGSLERSKERLMLIHVNNNDGINDLHLPPHSGKLTTDDFIAVLRTISTIDYDGYVSIELAQSDSDLASFSEARDFLSNLSR